MVPCFTPLCSVFEPSIVQELVRFNALLAVIRSSLVALGQAVKGLALMSTDLDALGRSLFDGKVPAMWLRKSFPSLKPLGSYIKEVLARVTFFSDWVASGPPAVFWISGFFFTQVRDRWLLDLLHIALRAGSRQ